MFCLTWWSAWRFLSMWLFPLIMLTSSRISSFHIQLLWAIKCSISSIIFWVELTVMEIFTFILWWTGQIQLVPSVSALHHKSLDTVCMSSLIFWVKWQELCGGQKLRPTEMTRGRKMRGSVKRLKLKFKNRKLVCKIEASNFAIKDKKNHECTFRVIKKNSGRLEWLIEDESNKTHLSFF